MPRQRKTGGGGVIKKCRHMGSLAPALLPLGCMLVSTLVADEGTSESIWGDGCKLHSLTVGHVSEKREGGRGGGGRLKTIRASSQGWLGYERGYTPVIPTRSHA